MDIIAEIQTTAQFFRNLSSFNGQQAKGADLKAAQGDYKLGLFSGKEDAYSYAAEELDRLIQFLTTDTGHELEKNPIETVNELIASRQRA